jgi:hypothetical protein
MIAVSCFFVDVCAELARRAEKWPFDETQEFQRLSARLGAEW